MAIDLKSNGFNVMPNLKICRNCYDQTLLQNEKRMESFFHKEDPDERLSRIGEDNDDQLDFSREQLNMSLKCTGVSPLK